MRTFECLKKPRTCSDQHQNNTFECVLADSQNEDEKKLLRGMVSYPVHMPILASQMMLG